MRQVILIRHGESEINAANKAKKGNVLCGQIETPLTEFGREQARTVGQLLAQRTDLRIAHAISSDLGRARETCEIILTQLLSQPNVLTPHIGFNERSLGHFEGRHEDDVFREHPKFLHDPNFCRFREDFEQKAPGGENLTDVTQRAWVAFETTFRQTTGNLLIVSHFNTIKCLIGRALKFSTAEILQIDIRNASPIILVAEGDEFRLVGQLPVRNLK